MKLQRLKASCQIISLFILLVGFGDSLLSQTVSISGKAKGSSGELVRVIVYADQFSLLPATISTTNADENGEFKLRFDVEETTFAFLGLGLKKAEFYLKSGATYDFTIPLDADSKAGSIFDNQPLRFNYEVEDNGLSDALTAFNVEYNSFLYENADKIYRGRDKSSIVAFKENLESKFKDVDDPYFKGYMKYTIASLEWISKMKSNREILLEYFVDQPILYQNIQYTEFFKEFFKSYFGYDEVFDYDDLIRAINIEGNIEAVKKLINRDSLFIGDNELRDLIATNLVAKKYYSNDVIRDNVIALLEELKLIGSSDEIRGIAGNYIVKLRKLEWGSPAPEFSLYNAEGDKNDLKQFEESHVLLSFFKPDCKMCLEHFQLLDELEKQFSGKLQNVTIIYGEPYTDVVKYASNRAFRWLILNLNNDILLLEAYNIRAYPTYVLINPDGTIGMSTAPMPDENLDLYISRQVSKFEKNKQEGKQ